MSSGSISGTRSGPGAGFPPPPIDGQPPFPPPGGPLGSGAEVSGDAVSFSASDQTTLSEIFASVLADTTQAADTTALSAAIERVKTAISNGTTPDDADMKVVMDATKTSIDDGTIDLDSNLALMQELIRLSMESHATTATVTA